MSELAHELARQFDECRAKIAAIDEQLRTLGAEIAAARDEAARHALLQRRGSLVQEQDQAQQALGAIQYELETVMRTGA